MYLWLPKFHKNMVIENTGNFTKILNAVEVRYYRTLTFRPYVSQNGEVSLNFPIISKASKWFFNNSISSKFFSVFLIKYYFPNYLQRILWFVTFSWLKNWGQIGLGPKLLGMNQGVTNQRMHCIKTMMNILDFFVSRITSKTKIIFFNRIV